MPVSILVLVEVLPWVIQASSVDLGGETVSILVLVEVLPWAYNIISVCTSATAVSILVLVEVLPWGHPAYAAIIRKSIVSILVLVEVLPWAGRGRNLYSDTLVSILVLVEVLPWAVKRFRVHYGPLKFQSLFWWKYCPGVKMFYFSVATHSVSILVLVEVLPWAYPGENGRVRGGAVSILVLVEVLPWVPVVRVRRCAPHPVSILVLVEVLPWAFAFGGFCALSIGFNPCSGGSIALGFSFKLAIELWITCFNPCSGGSIALGPHRLPGCSRVRHASFNPCSGGSIALGGQCASQRCPESQVSILVLVEVLPWGCCHNTKDNLVIRLRFNPCSGGSIALGTPS